MLFQYNYDRSKMLTSGQLQSASKQQLLKEARRLGGLIDRRIKQLTKAGYTSGALKRFDRQQRMLKRGTIYADPDTKVTSVSQSMSSRQLQDIIRSMDTFLSNKMSTVAGINSGYEHDMSQMSDASRHKLKQLLGGGNLTEKRYSKMIDVVANLENLSELSELIGQQGSDVVVPLIMTSKLSNEDLIDRIEKYMTSGQMVPQDARDILIDIFDDTDAVDKYLKNLGMSE